MAQAIRHVLVRVKEGKHKAKAAGAAGAAAEASNANAAPPSLGPAPMSSLAQRVSEEVTRKQPETAEQQEMSLSQAVIKGGKSLHAVLHELETKEADVNVYEADVDRNGADVSRSVFE